MTTITINRATVEQALEALTPWMDSDHTVQHAAYHALRAALAQQAEPVCKCDLRTRLVGDGCEVCNPKLAAELAQQAEPVEPVAWAFRHSDGTYHDPSVTEHSAGMVPLYPPPPQRKPLTDDELLAMWSGDNRRPTLGRNKVLAFARAVERALEEKNRGR